METNKVKLREHNKNLQVYYLFLYAENLIFHKWPFEHSPIHLSFIFRNRLKIIIGRGVIFTLRLTPVVPILAVS